MPTETTPPDEFVLSTSHPTIGPWSTLLLQGHEDAWIGKHHFLVYANACSNPECSCEDLTLSFREQRRPGRIVPIVFDVKVALDRADTPTVSALGPSGERLARSVTTALSGPDRQQARDALRDRRDRTRRIPSTVAAFQNNGEMVPFTHVLAGGGLTEATLEWYHEFEDDAGFTWLIEDFYCATATCNCQNVALKFTCNEEGDTPRHFEARVPFTGGTTTFGELREMTTTEAAALFQAWKEDFHIEPASFRKRYDEVRALAKQGQPPRPSSSRPSRPSPVSLGAPTAVNVLDLPIAGMNPKLAPVGRRESCPCGSGKRYKNCCGRNKA